MARNRSSFGMVFRRKRPSGRGGGHFPGFYVRIVRNGKPVERWAGPDRRTAEEFLGDLLRKTARRDLLGEKASSDATFAEMKPMLLAYMEARHAPSTLKGELGRVERVVEHFGERPLKSVVAGDVQEFLTALRSRRRRREGGTVVADRPASAATRNRYASTLSVAFRLAVEKGFAAANPVMGLRRQKEPRRAVPFMPPAEVDRILAAAADPRFRALLRVTADGGLRRSEETSLDWRDVDLKRGVVLVRKSKSGEPREVPMTEESRAAFEGLREARGPVPMTGPDPVWPEFFGKAGRASSRFVRLRTRLGMPALRLHDLRHGFCSRLAQDNVPIVTIAALAGHKSIATTMRYACHLPEGATFEAIRRLDRAQERLRKAQGGAGGGAAPGAAATGGGGGG